MKMLVNFVKTLVLTMALTGVAMAANNTVVDVAAGNKDFSTLVAAVKAAGLVDTLNGAGPFTVFAPTNEAFAKLPAGTLDDLLKPENKEKLKNILTYHVVAGKVTSAEIKNGEKKATVEGQDISFEKSAAGAVKVNNANVVGAEINASNGVIHVIDTVLMPAAK